MGQEQLTNSLEFGFFLVLLGFSRAPGAWLDGSRVGTNSVTHLTESVARLLHSSLWRHVRVKVEGSDADAVSLWEVLGMDAFWTENPSRWWRAKVGILNCSVRVACVERKGRGINMARGFSG